MIYETIYKRLLRLIPDLEKPKEEAYRLRSTGFMDLSVDILVVAPDYITLSLTHYFTQNGDLCPDPDMKIQVIRPLKMAEAMTYQDQFGFNQIYSDWSLKHERYEKVDVKMKNQLNRFLSQWLMNLWKQGFRSKSRMTIAEARKG